MVVAQYLMEDSSWDALVPKLQALMQRLQQLELTKPDVVYLDCTMAGQASVEAAVGVDEAHVLEDFFHGLNRITRVLPDSLGLIKSE